MYQEEEPFYALKIFLIVPFDSLAHLEAFSDSRKNPLFRAVRFRNFD